MNAWLYPAQLQIGHARDSQSELAMFLESTRTTSSVTRFGEISPIGENLRSLWAILD